MIRAAIFDLDGTILDSMGIWGQIDVEFLGNRGIRPPEDYQAAITPMAPADAAAYTIERFGLDNTPQELMDEWYEMAFRHYRDDIPLKPFAYDFIQRLYVKGFKIAIATSSYKEMVEAALARTGLSSMIELIVTSADVGKSKHEPDIYLRCAKLLGVQPTECIVYEDITEGVNAARGAGFLTVGVYEPAYYDTDGLRRAAGSFIHSYAELLLDDRIN